MSIIITELQENNKELKNLNQRLEGRFNLARTQYHAFLQEIIPHINSEKLKQVFQNLGKNCAKSSGWVAKFKGNPEGFFEHMKIQRGEEISFPLDKKNYRKESCFRRFRSLCF